MAKKKPKELSESEKRFDATLIDSSRFCTCTRQLRPNERIVLPVGKVLVRELEQVLQALDRRE
jgi:hypothetical protein